MLKPWCKNAHVMEFYTTLQSGHCLSSYNRNTRFLLMVRCRKAEHLDQSQTNSRVHCQWGQLLFHWKLKLKWQVPLKNKKNNYGINGQDLHLQDRRTQRRRLMHRVKAGVSQAPLAEVLPSAYYLRKGRNSHEAHHCADSLHLHCVPAR